MRSSRMVVTALLLAASGACSNKTTLVRPPAPSSTPTSPVPALVETLPVGCPQSAPEFPAWVTFVAGGRVWAVEPDGTGLTCLFRSNDAGPFDWGPRIDRVLAGGLSVRSATGATIHPPIGIEPTAFAWGQPTGKSIVFIDPRTPRRLKKLTVPGRVTDITPLPDVTYQSVEYHPSGLAIAFATEGKDINAIWLSSNTGQSPKRLVASTKGTRFGALRFDDDGISLRYAALLSDGTSRVSSYGLGEGTADEGLWTGPKTVLRFASGDAHGAAFDVGTGCEDRRAIYSMLNEGDGEPLLPDVSVPTTVIGEVEAGSFLVAAGPCSGPSDLWIANGAGDTTLLVKHVDRASIRDRALDPPPPLPKVGVSSRFF